MVFPGVRTVLVLFVGLFGGCQVDQGGLGQTTTGASATGTSGGATTAVDGSASTEGGATAGSGDATAGSETGASGTGTGDGTTGTSGDPPPEGTGSSDGESGDPSPGEGEIYGPCADGGTCNDRDAYCFESDGQDMCLPACSGDSTSCPEAPPDNGSAVECIEIPNPGSPHCMLNCAGGAMCPEGTTCVFLGEVFRCLWP